MADGHRRWVRLVDGSEAKIVSGVDDHSRFCISAQVVARATARPTCDALALAMRRHGVPEAILTDNGKVFTGRFGPGTGEVLFDRICRETGIKHLLTAPRSPTTTGKVERFHRTLREEFLTGNTFVPGSVVVIGSNVGRWLARVLAWGFEVSDNDPVVTLELLPVAPDAVERALRRNHTPAA